MQRGCPSPPGSTGLFAGFHHSGVFPCRLFKIEHRHAPQNAQGPVQHRRFSVFLRPALHWSRCACSRDPPAPAKPPTSLIAFARRSARAIPPFDSSCPPPPWRGTCKIVWPARASYFPPASSKPSPASSAIMPAALPRFLPPSCTCWWRSEEHTSELQSPCNLVCRLLLEK